MTLAPLALLLAACTYHPEPSLQMEEGVRVLRLVGTPYEMGQQHGELMREDLLAGAEWIDESGMGALVGLADYYGLLDEARANSFPSVVEECQGLVDGVGDEEAWTLDKCLILAYGDPILESLSHQLPGCSQFVAKGSATADGGVVHGRNLDWDEVSYMIERPTVIVRHPEGGIPWVAWGFPGNISPYSGMNAEGLVVASNEANGVTAPDGAGRAHTQMSRELLMTVETVADADAFLFAQDHVSAETLVISDATGDAGVFEMAVDGMARRSMANDVVWATNHFVDPVTAPLHVEVTEEDNTVSRFMRLEQLLTEGDLRGRIDLQTTIHEVLRDTTNPVTGVTHPADLFDGGGTLANNGAIHSLVFLPQERLLYGAVGGIPVPQNAFIGFDVAALVSGAGPSRAPLPVVE
ncbi:MAG: hypothetical protein JXX28_19715 [Deltaproteobacteria bacterium]|nr:hypothetical protein [Deltaproteobacteria bacterium]